MKKKAYIIRLSVACIVFIMCVLALFGFYLIPFLNLEFVPVIRRFFVDFSLISAIFLIFSIVMTIIFGRIYCSVLCPFGILQEIFSLIYLKFKKVNTTSKIFRYRYLLTALVFGCLAGGSAFLIRYIDPYSIFASFLSFRIYAVVFAILILVLVFFKNRFFCSNICPVGTVLGLISKISIFKNYMNSDCGSCGNCYRNCPTGCIDYKNKQVDNSTCVKCLKCLNVCPRGAMNIGVKPKEQLKFNYTRRIAVWNLSAVALFCAAYAMGVKFSKDAAQKFKNVILPAGAKDASRMINMCLNCNLCVQNCPNGILTKANEDFPCVHIDYNNGNKHCGYNCTRCSEVCPSGAIKKLDIKEKQQTKIASCKINDNCMGCRACVARCPKKAIEFVDYKAVIDETKCIGCGLCKNICPAGAITIKPIDEQFVI